MMPYLALSIALQLLAFQLTEGMVTVLIVQLVTVVLFILKDNADRRIRKEEREERAELARLTHVELAAVKEEGGNRESRIVNEVKEVKAAISAGGITQKVEVVNTPEHPVPVENRE